MARLSEAERFGYTLQELHGTGIYSIWHESKPGTYYVGSTGITRAAAAASQGFRLRWRLHLSEMRRRKHPNRKLQNVANKHGLSVFRFEILEAVAPDAGLLAAREQWWMSELNTMHPSGYNLFPTARSSLGRKMPNNGPGSKPVVQFYLFGLPAGWFPSAREAHRNTGVNWTKISLCCLGDTPTAGGYVWRFSGEAFSKYPLPKIDVSRKRIVQIQDGKPIKTWETISAAARALGLSIGNISECVHGRRTTTGGFVWKMAKGG